MPVMTHVSRPLIGLLVATVLFFALWLVALKPSSSTSSGRSGLGQYQSAINEAKASAVAQNRAAAAGGNTVAGAPKRAPAAAAKAKPAPAAAKAKPDPAAAAKAKPAVAAKHTTAAATKPATATHTAKHTATPKPAPAPRAATPSQRLNVVNRALAEHKVLALLFYNPAAPDDQAVKQELGTIPTHGGRVLKLAIPLREVANYPVVTTQVLIESSPTLVIVDRSRQAFSLVGYTSQFEIAHRVGDALSMR